MLRVPFDELYAALHRGTLALGLTGERAALCARLFAETTRDGVYSHGLNRFGRFTAMVRNGSVDVNAEPRRIAGFGCLERWDGRLGPGNLNAHACMSRAIELARQHGIGAVTIANTTHWMRGGTYGWLAAEAGIFAICWTNTMPNLPAWGAAKATLGNNPLIYAIPRSKGPVVVDIAMSQFSFGAIAGYMRRNEPLPVYGGYDSQGNLTRDAAAIEESQRALPIGYWKGSGLSIALDMMAAMLAGGHATHQIPYDPTRESGVSQCFIAIDPSTFASKEQLEAIADGIIASVHGATPVEGVTRPRYPGEQTLRVREENLRLGVPVEEDVWQSLLQMPSSANPG